MKVMVPNSFALIHQSFTVSSNFTASSVSLVACIDPTRVDTVKRLQREESKLALNGSEAVEKIPLVLLAHQGIMLEIER